MAKAKKDKIAEASVIVCHHRRQGRILCSASLDRTRRCAFCRGSSVPFPFFVSHRHSSLWVCVVTLGRGP